MRSRTQKLSYLSGRSLCRETTKMQTTCSSDEGRKGTKRREGRSRNHIHIRRPPPPHAQHTQRLGRENNRTKHDMLDIFINKLRLCKAVTDGFQGGGRRQKYRTMRPKLLHPAITAQRRSVHTNDGASASRRRPISCQKILFDFVFFCSFASHK